MFADTGVFDDTGVFKNAGVFENAGGNGNADHAVGLLCPSAVELGVIAPTSPYGSCSPIICGDAVRIFLAAGPLFGAAALFGAGVFLGARVFFGAIVSNSPSPSAWDFSRRATFRAIF